jgi:hypothetical protein
MPSSWLLRRICDLFRWFCCERAHAIKAEKFTICVAGLYNAVRNKRDHCVYSDFSVSV